MKIKIFFLFVLSVLSITIASGQKNNKKIVISGLVTDSQKKPIAGAMILVDEKNTNLVTNNRGLYKVRVRPDADTITIITSHNGASTEAIKGRTTINFTLSGFATSQQYLKEKQAKDEEIDIGYGSVSQKNLTTSVNKIDGSKYSTYRDIYEILKGTPGVFVTGRSIKIQGVSSLTLSTEPLFVVDGLTVESIDGISPVMVENISVLKGAAASIYGSRGSNGVILITLIKAPVIQ